MTNFLPRPGQLVRITGNAPGSIHDVAGQIGFIDPLSNTDPPRDTDRAQVHLLDTNGRLTGVGSHPINLLVPENDPIWVHARNLYEQRAQEFETEAMQRTQRWQAFVKVTAAEYNMTPETLTTLYHRMREQDPQY